MKRFAMVVFAVAAAGGAVQAKPLDPQRWRDDYLADPARKAMIERYVTPMEKETETALRTLALAKLVATRCRGSSLDADIVRDYVRESGLARLPPSDVELQTLVVNAEFNYFDLNRLKTVCAGAGYLFGDKGVLVPGLVSSGLGLPVWSEPRGEHWIAVEPFSLDVDGRTKALDGDTVRRPSPPSPRRLPGVGRHAAARPLPGDGLTAKLGADRSGVPAGLTPAAPGLCPPA